MAWLPALQAERLERLDLSGFLRVPPGTEVAEVLARMRQDRTAVALVEDGEGRLVGIFTERDVLQRIAGHDERLGDAVEDHMTAAPQTLPTSATVGDAVHGMNAGHHRNVPVVDAAGHAVGNLSQHAVIRFLTDHYPREIYNLPPDPDLIPRSREGA